jgi:hypothetical protein
MRDVLRRPLRLALRGGRVHLKGDADQPPPAVDDTAVVNMRLDAELLRRIDAAAKRQGITRTAWLSVAAARILDE